MAPSDVIRDRLARHTPQTAAEQDRALREALQEIILLGLSDGGFFEEAAFHGGTALRLAYGLPRFSEDLDFALQRPSQSFRWHRWGRAIAVACETFGLEPEILDRSAAGRAVQILWLKDSSLGKLLQLRFAHDQRRKLRIKLEVDTSPPAGASWERRFFDFPISYPVEVWDLPSSLAGKLHALLCRRYAKGRDWFDLIFYAQHRVAPNLGLLRAALDQQGPWAGTSPAVDAAWIVRALRAQVDTTDWAAARRDVEPFVAAPHSAGLRHWERALFQSVVDTLEQVMSAGPGQP